MCTTDAGPDRTFFPFPLLLTRFQWNLVNSSGKGRSRNRDVLLVQKPGSAEASTAVAFCSRGMRATSRISDVDNSLPQEEQREGIEAATNQ